MRKLAILISLFTVSAAPVPSTLTGFEPLSFFVGKTKGVGKMKIAFGPTREVLVHGSGTLLADGSIVLRQDVERENKKPEHREWRIRSTGSGTYTGTLSDAGGPITGETFNGRLHLTYRSKSGYAVEQWMTLAADGRSANNHLTARKMGVVVASLDETITKVD